MHPRRQMNVTWWDCVAVDRMKAGVGHLEEDIYISMGNSAKRGPRLPQYRLRRVIGIGVIVGGLAVIGLQHPRSQEVLAPGVQHAPPAYTLAVKTLAQAQPYVGFPLVGPPSPPGGKGTSYTIAVMPGHFFSPATATAPYHTSHIVFQIRTSNLSYGMTLKEEAGGNSAVNIIVHGDVSHLINSNGPYHRQRFEGQSIWVGVPKLGTTIDLVTTAHGVVYELTLANGNLNPRTAITYGAVYLRKILHATATSHP